MKIYAVIENFTQDTERDEDKVDTRIMSVHTTPELAIKAIEGYHDVVIDDIVDGDEDGLSRISADEHWDGYHCAVLTDDSTEWEWVIKEFELNLNEK